MKKFFKKLHLWLSLPFAIIITIICVTGSLLVFQSEIQECMNPHLYFVEEVKQQPLPIPELIAKAEQQLPDSITVTGFRIMQDPARTYQLRLKGTRATFMIDPYTGIITGSKGRSKFFSKVSGLHTRLLGERRSDSIPWGKWIVGASTLAFVFILISGLVIWFPKSRKKLKTRFSISAKKGWYRFFFDLHVSGGFYASIFLLAMALTGLNWSFDWYNKAFYSLLGKETEPQKRQEKVAFPKQDELNFSQWDNVLAQMHNKYEDYNSISIQKNTVSVTYGNINKRDSYDFNPETGEIVSSQLYEDQSYNSKLRGWVWAFHSGRWGGMTTRILHCLAAFLGAVFCITGYYFWIKKKVNKRNKKDKVSQKAEE